MAPADELNPSAPVEPPETKAGGAQKHGKHASSPKSKREGNGRRAPQGLKSVERPNARGGKSSESASASSFFRPSSAPPGKLRGPERFFYDKNTYTGVHKHGGPCHNDVGEGNFASDLSCILRRGLHGSGSGSFFGCSGSLSAAFARPSSGDLSASRMLRQSSSMPAAPVRKRPASAPPGGRSQVSACAPSTDISACAPVGFSRHGNSRRSAPHSRGRLAR